MKDIELRFLKLVLLFLVSAAVSCGPERDYFPPPETDGGWRKNTNPGFVHSLGLDPEKLSEFGSYNLSVENSNWKPYADHKGILVIKNGWILGEWYNTPAAREFQTYLSSNGKAFAMVCFGIMSQDSATGNLEYDIDQDSLVYDQRWLPEGFPLSDPGKQRITFEQIFRHTSGLCPERSGTGEAIEKGRNEWTDYSDWVVGHDQAWPQTAGLYFSPGEPESWHGKEVWGEQSGGYSSVSFGHIGLVLKNVYAIPAHEFLRQRLLVPLGFSGIDFHAPPDSDNQWFSAGGLRMTPRDYARFAYFLLKEGRWGDDQIVPKEWLDRFCKNPLYPNIRSNQDGFFGNYSKDMFRIAGSGLNWAFMIPSLDLIAIRTGRAANRHWDEVEQQFLQKLFAAIRAPQLEVESLPAQPQKGQIIADQEDPQWLRRRDVGTFFMAGPGDPEDFLYRGKLRSDGTRDGDQMELIHRLQGTGANSIYLMAVRSHGGDGDDTHNPFVDHDPAKGLNQKVLDQWERWFVVMDRQRITIFFFFFDDGARLSNKANNLSALERSFIRSLVNRFKHHKNLIWCLSEEYQEAFSVEAIREFAAEVRRVDELKHPIAVHKLSGTDFEELAGSPAIDQFAMQLGLAGNRRVTPEYREVHRQVVDAWMRSGGRYNLNMSELAGHYESGQRASARLKSWAAAMGGAYVMVIGMDIESTEREALQDCGRMVRFFESTDFRGMSPRDDFGLEGTQYVLAKPTGPYIAYSYEHSGLMGLRGLESGQYSFRWFDCSTGRESLNRQKLESGDQSWKVPDGFGSEIALYLERLP